MTKHYVESCFYVTPKRVYNTLDRIGRKIGDNRDLKRTDIRYEYDQIGEKYFVLVTVGNNMPQKILLDEVETSFCAPKEYFHCPGCDNRVCKLYLLPNGHEFKCKKCHGLKYARQYINPSSKHGKVFLQTHRILKLINEREQMNRIFYNSTYTKRFNKWLDSALKLGMKDLVYEARELESVISTKQ